MDKNNTDFIKDILSSYEEITVVGENKEIIFFELFGKEYGCWYPDVNRNTSSPIFLVKNDNSYEYPHILPLKIPAEKDQADHYRFICLYEADSTIKFLQNKDEKVRDAIERLLALLQLSTLEREREFQKEFLYYWGKLAQNVGDIKIYIEEKRKTQRMNTYYECKDKSNIRLVANGVKLNDSNNKVDGKKKWLHIPEIPAFYIPVEDIRRILPPTYSVPWTEKDIIKIIEGKDIRRISHESYLKISKEKVKSEKVILVFEMIVNKNYLNFTAIIALKNSKNDTLLNHLKNDITEVIPIKSSRVDYFHLCRQIGNDMSLLNKKILLVGAGSLGSYIAKELVKTGIRELTIYDEDRLEPENILRHSCTGFWTGCYKVSALKYELESIHPEIFINAVNKNIDESILKKEIEKYDLVIFTVGSSDIQLELNRVIKQNNYKIPVFYVWLEAGGHYSHILTVDYTNKGCFECLYTDVDGRLINNKANAFTDIEVRSYKIQNGCGATRVAYGNVILLRTSSVVLDTIAEFFAGKMHENCLIDITPNQVSNRSNIFYERKCRCCGNGDCK